MATAGKNFCHPGHISSGLKVAFLNLPRRVKQRQTPAKCLADIRRQRTLFTENNMKRLGKYAAFAVVAATVAALGMMAGAQPPEGGSQDGPPPRDERRPPPEGRRPPPPPPRDGRRPPPPPLETALDADDDGEISPAELDNASSALKQLDKNADGKLTPEEYRPPRPPRVPGSGERDRDFRRRPPGNERDREGPPPPRRGRRPPPPHDVGEGDDGPRSQDD